MDALTGKGRGILLRLPHFFDPEQAGPLLLDVVDAFGRGLERAEGDLYEVLRSHHVETAENEAAGGYTAPLEKRGDLDKILSLYLEVLGGTSHLVKVSPAFTPRSIDARRLAAALAEPDSSHPLRPYLRRRFARRTWELVLAFRVERTRITDAEVRAGLVMELLLERSPVASYIVPRLAEETRALLGRHRGGAEVDPRLAAALRRDLNDRVLPDPGLYRALWPWWEERALPEAARALRAGIFGAFLRGRLAAPDPTEAERALPDARRGALAADLAGADPAPVPAGDDLRRLNRLLLETAWAWDPAARPWGLRPRGIPLLALPRGAPAAGPVRAVREALVAELNRLLDDPGLAAPERFPELAEELPALRRRFRGQTAWLNRVLLEAAFPRSIERSYKPYRERLLGLIQVLRRGASTPRGILDIVAANLGIVGDGPEVEAARALIQVQEFDPRQKAFFEGQVGFWDVFAITSDNPGASAPRVQVTVLDQDGIELANLRLRDERTDHAVLYPGRLRAGDELLLEGGGVLLNGVAPPKALLGTVPELPRGTSRWKLDADVVVFGAEAGAERGVPVGRFDMPVGATFDGAALAPEGPIAKVEVFSYRHTPGVFKVVIPWNIPGFTDKFDAEDHPRQQILPLVNRVKAAGVQALVAYREVFAETHDVDEALRLKVSGRLLAEAHDAADDYRFFSRQTAAEDQGQQDALVVNGVFDYTTFDSLNTFA